ncbi:MAG: efflux RND transporter permease subunit [Cellvibrionaceae bacterium]|nr:efflux RND transporter permease subunit [Cellvibrionaceae bacterium]
MRGIIDWFVDNPIAANLLMLLIVCCGFIYFPVLGKEVFPQSDVDTLSISAAYAGASAREIEQQVLIRLEESIADLEGIDEMSSTASEGSAHLSVDVRKGYDTTKLLNAIEARLDGLTSLPDEVDDLQVRESIARRPLMSVAVYGNVAESLLKETAQWLQQELLSLDAVAVVDIENTRNREMTIDVSAKTLRAYGLRFDDLARVIRDNSINLPAGAIKTRGGDVQLQARGQGYSAQDFADIIVREGTASAQLRLGDIATVRDNFEDVDSRGNFNGYPVAYLELYTTDPPDIVSAARGARTRLDALRQQLPPGVVTEVWFDWSKVYQSRMDLLLDNTLTGLALVFIVLMLFLRPSLAAWVCVGIATTILGVFWLLPFTGVTLNMLSMYGFLLALGIIVDDAIVVGESIYGSQQRGLSGRKGAKLGVMLVHKPVIFAVVSTIIFFSAMFGLDDDARALAVPIAVVVIVCLFFSLVESLLILPSHLSHWQVRQQVQQKQAAPLAWFFALQARLSQGMERVARQYYQAFLSKTLKCNAVSLTVFAVIFAIVLTLFMISGYLKKSFRPIVPSSRISITAVLPEGVGFEQTLRVQQQIEAAAYALRGDAHLLNINGDGNFISAVQSSADNNRARVRVRLTDSHKRTVNIIQVKNRWRELIGPIAGVKEFSLRFTINHNRKDLRFRIRLPGNDQQQLARAVNSVRDSLSRYQAVVDIEDTLEGSRTEIELQLKPHAQLLGLSLADVASQLRQGFLGAEVQRIPRGRDDIKVMLRYPLAQRRSIESIRQLTIFTAHGHSVPLDDVAEIIAVPGYTKIKRENRQRTVAVTANVTKGTDSLALANSLLRENYPQWQQQYRGLTVEIDGAVADEQAFNRQLLINFGLAFVVSFGLMAIVFRSCWQPVLILTAIPFGFVGAVLGHLLLGQAITMNSMLGFVACAGVVVNDNLVLLDRIHRLREEGKTVMEAIVQGGSDRFRAIMLTSITTFVGLLPILSETSIQAQFLMPMVISLAFGVLFATGVTLIFVPNLYYLGERIKQPLLIRFRKMIFTGESVVR